MTHSIKVDSTYSTSEDIISRVIDGELIIVPLVAGIGNTDDELFTLNDTGKSIWELLDGERTPRQIIKSLLVKYGAPEEEIKKDVIGLLAELFKRRIIIEKKAN